ncbi:MAG: hypothetical protein ACAH83_17800 [Alphaproteobacteria bacterium]
MSRFAAYILLLFALATLPITARAQQQVNRATAAANTVNAVNGVAAAPSTAAPAAAGTAAPATAAGSPAPAAPAPSPAEVAVDIHLPFKQSFFFTSEDIISIKKAMEQQKVAPSSATGQASAAPVIPPIRRIALSGVVYKAADDWLIWINGQKVTPTVSMKEIVDIQVEREKVHLKWFDIGANYIIDITMRPNETYDITTGVLLPGIMK